MMETIGDRLKTIRLERGLTQEQLGKIAGVGKMAISKIESGRTKSPEAITIEPICRKLGYSFQWLMSGNGEKRTLSDGGPKVVRIPAYEIEAVEDGENFDPEREIWVQGVDIEVSAGPGRVVPEFVPTSYRQRFTLKWLRDVGAKAEDLRVLRVVGDSMEPLVYEGDKVTIDLARKKVESGRVYVIVSGGEAKVKRLFRSADGRIRIVSDNADKTKYPDEYVGQDDDGFLVIGRVVDKSGRGGL
jgi:phage repressor protein C with HTH and peptisase S24 domain